MKFVRNALVATTLLMAACTEKGPHIDFGNSGSGGSTPSGADTTYIATAPARQDRVVLMQEFTGVSCPPCPNGHRIIDTLEAQHEGRLAVIGIQPYGIPQANPIEGITRTDNRSQRGTDFAKEYGGVGSQIPVAFIDLIPDAGTGQFPTDRSQWVSVFNTRAAVPSPVNLYLTPTYTTGDGQLSLHVKIVYTDTVSGFQYLNLAIVEDNVIDGQTGLGFKDSNYVHKHVFRDFLYEGVIGRRFLDSLPTISRGRVFETNVNYKMNSAWNVSNCKVVGYVNRVLGSDKRVQQAIETKITP